MRQNDNYARPIFHVQIALVAQHSNTNRRNKDARIILNSGSAYTFMNYWAPIPNYVDKAIFLSPSVSAFSKGETTSELSPTKIMSVDKTGL